MLYYHEFPIAKIPNEVLMQESSGDSDVPLKIDNELAFSVMSSVYMGLKTYVRSVKLNMVYQKNYTKETHDKAEASFVKVKLSPTASIMRDSVGFFYQLRELTKKYRLEAGINTRDPRRWLISALEEMSKGPEVKIPIELNSPEKITTQTHGGFWLDAYVDSDRKSLSVEFAYLGSRVRLIVRTEGGVNISVGVYTRISKLEVDKVDGIYPYYALELAKDSNGHSLPNDKLVEFKSSLSVMFKILLQTNILSKIEESTTKWLSV